MKKLIIILILLFITFNLISADWFWYDKNTMCLNLDLITRFEFNNLFSNSIKLYLVAYSGNSIESNVIFLKDENDIANFLNRINKGKIK